MIRKAIKEINFLISKSTENIRFRIDYPFLKNYDSFDFRVKFPDLSKNYLDYTNTVSKPDSTISLEFGKFIYFLCCKLKPKSVLDTGSGFSSYVFRSYKKNIDHRCQVYSVDDNPFWLETTRIYLLKNNLSIENLITWDDFMNLGPVKFDFISHDIGQHQTHRVKSLPFILKHVHTKSTIIIDDMHKPHFREPIKDILKKYSIRCYDVKEYTLDDYGRYSWILTGLRY